jgi:hypothetical protein
MKLQTDGQSDTSYTQHRKYRRFKLETPNGRFIQEMELSLDSRVGHCMSAHCLPKQSEYLDDWFTFPSFIHPLFCCSLLLRLWFSKVSTSSSLSTSAAIVSTIITLSLVNWKLYSLRVKKILSHRQNPSSGVDVLWDGYIWLTLCLQIYWLICATGIAHVRSRDNLTHTYIYIYN